QTREQAAEVRFNLAHALFSVGQFERAKESFLLAEDLAVALGDHRRRALIHGGMTYLMGSEGYFEDARQSGLRALTIATSLGDLGLQVWISIGLGRVYFAQGNYRAAIERMRWVTGALKDAPVNERFGRGSLMPSVGCRAWLALCLGHIGEYPEAIAWGGEGVRIARRPPAHRSASGRITALAACISSAVMRTWPRHCSSKPSPSAARGASPSTLPVSWRLW